MANPVYEKPATKKVTTGVRKETGFLQKMANILLADNIEEAKKRIFYDLIVPTVKRTIVSSVETIVWGYSSPKNVNSQSGYKYYNYSTPNQPQQRSYNPRDFYDSGTICVPTRGEAELVIDQLNDNIRQYGATSVADLCEACDISSNPTDYTYGWTDLSNARIIPSSDGFIIKLPKALPLVR